MQLFAWSPPSFIPTEAWDAFVEMRKAKGKRAPFTDRARDLLVRQLEQMHQQGLDVGAALEQSVINGWSGVFPARNQLQHSRREQPANEPFVPTSKQGNALAALQGMKR